MPGTPATKKRRAPAEVRPHLSADHVTERSPDRNRHVKYRVHARAALRRKQVREERRGDGHDRGLADPDQRARGEQVWIAVREAGEHRREAPDTDAEGDRARARTAVAPRAEHRRRHHVDEDKRRQQRAELRIRERHVALQIRGERGDHITIEVVQQINRGEQPECPIRGAARGRRGDLGR